MKQWGDKRYYSLDYYINETFGLLGTVTAIVVEEENSAQASRIVLD